MRRILLAILLLTVVSSTGSIQPALAQGPLKGGTMVLAVNADPSTICATITTDLVGQLLSGMVYSGLVRYNPDKSWAPDLAESWEVSTDARVITFHLNKNAFFHDGKPVTSADVKFSINASKTYNPMLLAYSHISSIETPDPYTVTVRQDTSFAPLLFLFIVAHVPILPMHIYAGTDLPKNPNNNAPIGSGAFKFVEWKKGEYIKLEKNPKYYRDGPYLDAIIMRPIPDATARLLALEKGEVDYVYYYGFPFSELERVKKLPGIEVKMSLWWDAVVYVMWNVREPPLNNLGVRQAIAYALDRTQIANLATYGTQKPAVSILPSSMSWAFNPDVPKYPRDLAKANQLLDQAGYAKKADGSRMTLSLLIESANIESVKAGEVMREQLREVGIDLKLEALEQATVLQRFKDWQFQMSVFGLATGPEPYIYTGRFLRSKQILHIPATNVMGYNNSRVDQLYDESIKSADLAVRAKSFREIQSIVMQELPVIPLWERIYPTAYKTDFANIAVTASHHDPWNEAYWKKGTPLTTAVTTMATTTVGPTPTPDYTYPILGIVAIAVIAVALYYTMRRRSKPEKPKT